MTLGLVAALAAGRTRAQAGPRSPRMVRLSEMKGADVLAADESKPVGKIEDLTVDFDTGRARAVFVRVGTRCADLAHDVVVPAKRRGAYRVLLTDKDLESLPDTEVPTLEDVPPTEPVKADREGARNAERTAVPVVAAASSLIGLEVPHGDRTFGLVEDVVLEERTGTLAFVEIRAGTEPGQRGDATWVPWAACELERPRRGDAEDGAWRLAVRAGERDLVDAPGPGSGVLTDPLFRGRIYRFFAVEQPEYEEARGAEDRRRSK